YWRTDDAWMPTDDFERIHRNLVDGSRRGARASPWGRADHHRYRAAARAGEGARDVAALPPLSREGSRPRVRVRDRVVDRRVSAAHPRRKIRTMEGKPADVYPGDITARRDGGRD